MSMKSLRVLEERCCAPGAPPLPKETAQALAARFKALSDPARVSIVNLLAGAGGIDVSDRKPKPISEDDTRWADVVVTMGCGDACPVVPGKEYVDWELPDPAGMPLADVRALRDEVERRVGEL